MRVCRRQRREKRRQTWTSPGATCIGVSHKCSRSRVRLAPRQQASSIDDCGAMLQLVLLPQLLLMAMMMVMMARREHDKRRVPRRSWWPPGRDRWMGDGWTDMTTLAARHFTVGHKSKQVSQMCNAIYSRHRVQRIVN